MEKLSPTPDELRLVQYGVIDGVRNGTLIPSSLLWILAKTQDEELRAAMISAYERTASPEYKVRFEKVREALQTLQELDKPDLENTSL